MIYVDDIISIDSGPEEKAKLEQGLEKEFAVKKPRQNEIFPRN